MPVWLHNLILFYKEDEETEDIDEMEQPMQDPPLSPLNEPQDFEKSKRVKKSQGSQDRRLKKGYKKG